MAKDKEKTFYETKLVCKNCQNEIEVQIPVGTPVKVWRQKNKCNICKCALK